MEKHNKVKAIACEIHEKSWDKLITNVENDINGRQEIAYITPGLQ